MITHMSSITLLDEFGESLQSPNSTVHADNLLASIELIDNDILIRTFIGIGVGIISSSNKSARPFNVDV